MAEWRSGGVAVILSEAGFLGSLDFYAFAAVQGIVLLRHRLCINRSIGLRSSTGCAPLVQSSVNHACASPTPLVQSSYCVGMGEPTTNRGATVVPRARVKTHLQTEEIGTTTKYKTRSTWMLIAARSGHGHFAVYHQRFSHEEKEDWQCSCGNYRAPLHPFRCTNERAHRTLL